MTFKHTPGPWTVQPSQPDHGDSTVICSGDLVLARIESACWRDDDASEDKANANLIAAAPDLLAALQAIRDAGSYDDADNFVIPPGEWDGKYDPPDTSDHPAIVAMYVALHKATGG